MLLRDVVKSTLSDWGGVVTFTRMDPGNYDVATGKTLPTATTTYTGVGRVGTPSDETWENSTVSVNTRVLTFIPDDISFVPREGEQFTYNGETFAVVAPIVQRKKQNEVICYSMGARNVTSNGA